LNPVIFLHNTPVRSRVEVAEAALNGWLGKEFGMTLEEVSAYLTVEPFIFTRTQKFRHPQRDVSTNIAGPPKEPVVHTVRSYIVRLRYSGLNLKIILEPPTGAFKDYTFRATCEGSGWVKLDPVSIYKHEHGLGHIDRHDLKGFDYKIRHNSSAAKKGGKAHTTSDIEGFLQKEATWVPTLNFIREIKTSGRLAAESVLWAFIRHAKVAVFDGLLEVPLYDLEGFLAHKNFVVEHREDDRLPENDEYWADKTLAHHARRVTFIRRIDEPPSWKDDQLDVNFQCPWYTYASLDNGSGVYYNKTLEAHMIFDGRMLLDRQICTGCSRELACLGRQFKSVPYDAQMLRRALDVSPVGG
jgi:hypothetical protein